MDEIEMSIIVLFVPLLIGIQKLVFGSIPIFTEMEPEFLESKIKNSGSL